MSDVYGLIWRRDDLTPTQKLVLLAVARFSTLEGVCYAFRRSIAKATGLHPKTVQATMQDLAAPPFELVQITERTGADGRQSSNLVRLTISGVLDSTVAGVEVGPMESTAPHAEPRTPHKGKQDAPCGAQDSTSKDRGNSNDSELESQSATADAVDPVHLAFTEWNLNAINLGLPEATKLTETRRKKLAKRLEESGPDGWRVALGKVANSRFLRGLAPGRDGAAPFKATLDFLLQPSSFQKVIEGAYGEDAPRPAKAQDSDLLNRLRHDPLFALKLVQRWDQDAASWPDWAGPAPGQDGCQAHPDALAPMAERIAMRTQRAPQPFPKEGAARIARMRAEPYRQQGEAVEAALAKARGQGAPPTDDSDMLV